MPDTIADAAAAPARRHACDASTSSTPASSAIDAPQRATRTRSSASTPTARAAAARAADAERRRGIDRGPLHGIPISLKDLIDVAGAADDRGVARARRPRGADATRPLVTRLREAGAVLIGKTNLHEFALGTTSEDSAFGPVRHPRDPSRSAGGSSGGSAAAVATGMGLASIGTRHRRIDPHSRRGLRRRRPQADVRRSADRRRRAAEPVARSRRAARAHRRTTRASLWAVLADATGRAARVVRRRRSLQLASLGGYFDARSADDVRAAFDAALDALRRAGVHDRRGDDRRHRRRSSETYVEHRAAGGARTGTRRISTRVRASTRRRSARGFEAGRAIPAVDYLAARDQRAAAARERSTRRSRPSTRSCCRRCRSSRRRFGAADVTIETPTRTEALPVRSGDAAQHAALQHHRPSGDLAAAPGDRPARRPAARRPARRDRAAARRSRPRASTRSMPIRGRWSSTFPSPKRTHYSSRAPRTSTCDRPAEFDSGHPAGAVNVPLFEPDEDTGQMTPNPDFVRVMQATFPRRRAAAHRLPGRRPLDARGADARVVRLHRRRERARRLRRHARSDGPLIDRAGSTSGLPVDTGARRTRAYATCSTRPTPTRDRPVLSRLGAPARVGRHQPRRAAVRVGPRLARPRRRTRPIRAARVRAWVAPRDGRHGRVLPHRRRPTTTSGAATPLTLSERARHAGCRSTTPSSSASFPPRIAPGRPRRAVVVLPQWNCGRRRATSACASLFARFGITRAAPEPALSRRAAARRSSQRADYIVSANVGRTLQVNRQAVLDAKRARRLARRRKATSASASSARASGRACRC